MSATPKVLSARDVPKAGGPPRIEAIVDIGSPQLPAQGSRLTASGGQGRAVIGELVVLRGADFGKQPRVSVGGRGAEVLAHVEDGVVLRVPWGIDPGTVEVEVVHHIGRSSRSLKVQRVGLAVLPGKVRFFTVDATGKSTLGSTLALAGVEAAVFSYDGSAAYLVGQGKKPWIKVVDVTGAKPKVVNEFPLPGKRIVAVDTAVQVPMGVVVTDTHAVLFNSKNSTIPVLYAPHVVAEQIRRKTVLAASIGGMGKSLALLLADLNEVALFDVSEPSTFGYLKTAKVLPGEPLSLVQDMRFSPDGASLWVASGDNWRSHEGGKQPARVTLLHVVPQRTEEGLSVHRTWEVGENIAVFSLAVARGEPIPAGTAIRAEPSSSAVYLSAAPTDVLTTGLSTLADKDAARGHLLRTSIDKESVTLVAGAHLLTSQDVAGKTEVVLGLGCRNDGGKPVRTLVGGRAWEKGTPHLTDLGPLPAGILKKKPYNFGMIRVQP